MKSHRSRFLYRAAGVVFVLAGIFAAASRALAQAPAETFVIDRAGKIASSHPGCEDAATFEKETKRLL